MLTPKNLPAENVLLQAELHSAKALFARVAALVAGSEADVQQLLAISPARWRAYVSPVSGSALGAVACVSTSRQ